MKEGVEAIASHRMRGLLWWCQSYAGLYYTALHACCCCGIAMLLAIANTRVCGRRPRYAIAAVRAARGPWAPRELKSCQERVQSPAVDCNTHKVWAKPLPTALHCTALAKHLTRSQCARPIPAASVCGGLSAGRTVTRASAVAAQGESTPHSAEPGREFCALHLACAVR